MRYAIFLPREEAAGNHAPKPMVALLTAHGTAADSIAESGMVNRAAAQLNSLIIG